MVSKPTMKLNEFGIKSKISNLDNELEKAEKGKSMSLEKFSQKLVNKFSL